MEKYGVSRSTVARAWQEYTGHPKTKALLAEFHGPDHKELLAALRSLYPSE
jgi:hypothetical protein